MAYIGNKKIIAHSHPIIGGDDGSYDEGYAKGYTEGEAEGYTKGKGEGWNLGYTEGFAIGEEGKQAEIDAIDAKLDEIIAIQNELLGIAKLITFTISGEEYTATEGMAWGVWVESEYNTIGAEFEFGTFATLIRVNGLNIVDVSTGFSVVAEDTINSEINYGYN